MQQSVSQFKFVPCPDAKCVNTPMVRKFFEQFGIVPEELRAGSTAALKLRRKVRWSFDDRDSAGFPLLAVKLEGSYWAAAQPTELQLLEAAYLAGDFMQATA